MDEELIQSIALFFYLNLFDSRLTYAATQKALIQWRKQVSGGAALRAQIIPIVSQILSKSHRLKEASDEEAYGIWGIPDNLDLQHWRDFKKSSENKEYTAVLWTRVIGFTDHETALGLNVSEGTIRHRTQRGLKKLGAAI